ncbi:hypothetical protein [Methylobacterium sp. SD21]|uniref:hypothetical protein n=1 Tax=Methylobacterium litchii TaxID=3138810 RepID=UPI00313E633F
MNAPFLSLVPTPAAEPVSNSERLMAHGQLVASADALAHAVEGAHSAAFFASQAASRGGGYPSDVERLERTRELLRETARRVDEAIDMLADAAGRRL